MTIGMERGLSGTSAYALSVLVFTAIGTTSYFCCLQLCVVDKMCFEHSLFFVCIDNAYVGVAHVGVDKQTCTGS